MTEKQTRRGKELSRVFIGILLGSILMSGCGGLNRSSAARSAFEEANTFCSQGSYQASLNIYDRIAEEHPSVRDRVLFEKGIIYAHPENEEGDYRKAAEYFKKLVKEYPDSQYRQNSETMLFTIGNTALKDATIAAQQAKITSLQQEIKGKESEVRALKQGIESLERKHFALALEKVATDKILIEKEKRRMTLFLKGEVLKTYNIALGGDPIGPKERVGDNKTPEGIYTIDSRNRDSRYHLALRLSYPNERDRKRASELGVSPGGDIMIHGLRNGFSRVGDAHAEVDWTKGCIAVTDKEIEEIDKLAPNGTMVEIMP